MIIHPRDNKHTHTHTHSMKLLLILQMQSGCFMTIRIQIWFHSVFRQESFEPVDLNVAVLLQNGHGGIQEDEKRGNSGPLTRRREREEKERGELSHENPSPWQPGCKLV